MKRSPPMSLVRAQGEAGRVLLVLEAEEHLVIEAGVGLADFDVGALVEVEVAVADEEVVGQVEALGPGELFPDVDADLLSGRCRGTSC